MQVSQFDVRDVYVYRYAPGAEAPHMEHNVVRVDKARKMTSVLDVLDAIPEQNAGRRAVVYRRACREGICGSCALNINGRNRLACKTDIKDLPRRIEVRPLPHFRVLKDLVVDMEPFFAHHAHVAPHVIKKDGGTRRKAEGEREDPQSVEDREKLDGLWECVLCGCCAASCPEYWWNSNRKVGANEQSRDYLGPAALQQALRWVLDSRDEGFAERVAMLKEWAGGEGATENCHAILGCSAACPQKLNPARSVHALRDIVAMADE